MYRIPLTNVPNQQINFNVDGAYWQLHIYAAIEHMCVDISRNGVLLAEGVRCFGGIQVVPYFHMYRGYGNFIFNGEPDWEQFGGAVNLFYLSAAELAEYNAQIDESYMP